MPDMFPQMVSSPCLEISHPPRTSSHPCVLLPSCPWPVSLSFILAWKAFRMRLLEQGEGRKPRSVAAYIMSLLLINDLGAEGERESYSTLWELCKARLSGTFAGSYARSLKTGGLPYLTRRRGFCQVTERRVSHSSGSRKTLRRQVSHLGENQPQSAFFGRPTIRGKISSLA